MPVVSSSDVGCQSLNWTGDVEEAARAIISMLQLHGWRILKNLPAGSRNIATVQLAKVLGRPFSGTGASSESVYVVSPRALPAIEPDGSVVISTTNLAFPFHTGGSGNDLGYDLVLLCCEAPAVVGGESLLLDTRPIYETLSPNARRLLCEAAFSFPCGIKPVVDLSTAFTIRYSEQNIDLERV